MKNRFWLLPVLLLVFALGRLSHRVVPAGVEREDVQVKSGRAPAGAGDSAARETSRKRWAERLQGTEGEGMAGLLKEMPKGDRGAALELWLGSFGLGGMDTASVDRFRRAIDAWVIEDPDAVLAWAEALRDPGMREAGMTAVAGSLARSDPQRAFDCLVAHGEFKHSLLDGRIMGLMKGLSKDAGKQGPEAIAALWGKLPKVGDSVNAFSGVALELEPGTDFLTLSRALRREMGAQMSRPIFPVKVMETWVREDPAGARAYFMELAAAKERCGDEWSEIRSTIRTDQGAEAADAWALGLLRDLPAGDRGQLLAGAGYLHSPSNFHELMRSAGEEEAALWIGETLQASVEINRGSWGISNLLGELPMEQRVQHLKALRGEQALQYANEVMANWNLPEAQREEVRSGISGS
ncbi:hypothetical protein OJ996_22150 [Luteolibacter sp. GHJ8]|uniref:HEAT repeat domain-containing protein n=1 Tax=Luteolibacter rhizosphaerae TaxID=2989719 RepID=A0ABT3G8Y4_9BACT|nr:hypothetical protein [Luteolibacter rhizosphaerae]MCW1916308.1 hypothetical protein [Luteolibacter rhizosphaerae]